VPPRLHPPTALRLVGDLLTRLSRDRLERGEEPLSEETLRVALEQGPEELERVALAYALRLGTPRYTAETMARLAGLSTDTAARLWLALGFAGPDRSTAVFTDGDLLALREVRVILEEADLDLVDVVQLARLVGQSLARISDAVVGVLEHAANRSDATRPDAETAIGLAALAGSDSMRSVERLLVYAWKRHLAASIRRTAARGFDDGFGAVICVGFADITGFTRLSQRLDHRRLGELLDRFAATADDAVVARGARIVKTLGDEIMFVVPGPLAAVDIARTLAAGFPWQGQHVELHVGLAMGPVLSRDGDFYGHTVNLAKRLTEAAAPGTALADSELAAALDAIDRDTLLERAPVGSTGVDPTAAWKVRAPHHDPKVAVEGPLGPAHE